MRQIPLLLCLDHHIKYPAGVRCYQTMWVRMLTAKSYDHNNSGHSRTRKPSFKRNFVGGFQTRGEWKTGDVLQGCHKIFFTDKTKKRNLKHFLCDGPALTRVRLLKLDKQLFENLKETFGRRAEKLLRKRVSYWLTLKVWAGWTILPLFFPQQSPY